MAALGAVVGLVGGGLGLGGVLCPLGLWGNRRPLQVGALTAAANAVGGGVLCRWRPWGRRYLLSVAELRAAA